MSEIDQEIELFNEMLPEGERLAPECKYVLEKAGVLVLKKQNSPMFYQLARIFVDFLRVARAQNLHSFEVQEAGRISSPSTGSYNTSECAVALMMFATALFSPNQMIAPPEVADKFSSMLPWKQMLRDTLSESRAYQPVVEWRTQQDE